MVMMTLVRRDDRGEEMNQEEADQDVADEVSEEADSRGEVMRSEKNVTITASAAAGATYICS